jgi:hypothetical protein
MSMLNFYINRAGKNLPAKQGMSWSMRKTNCALPSGAIPWTGAIGRGGGEACCAPKTVCTRGIVELAVACALVAGRATAASVPFDIAPQDLSNALIIFSDQSHLRITVWPDIAQRRSAP